ncbi:MAG TPA: hypothetical protein VE422_42640 [Terriglobia bacterium]|nr:hypothetical protein [Terriglobia bacterium]
MGSEGGAGTRDGRGAVARFNRPRGIWSDGTFAYVPDQGNSTIRRIELATGDVRTIAGTPQQPQAGRIVNPGLVWGQGSFLYFVDGLVIRRLDISTGAITTFAGSTSGTADGTGEKAQFRGPYAITGNASHIYVLDSPLILNGVTWSSPALIREISISSGDVRTLPSPSVTPTALPYDVDPTALWADDDFLYLTFVSSPGTLALGRMSLQDFQFTPLMGFPLPQPDSRYLPRNLWSDGQGNFFFSDGSNIREAVLSTREVSLVASAPPASSRVISGIWGIGNTLIATDQNANIVFRVNSATKQVSTLAGLPYTAPSRDEGPPPLRLSEGTIPPEQFGATSVTGGEQFLYASSGYAVYKISLATREITHLAGAFNERGTKDGIGADARFADPTSLFNLGRYLFVVDEGIDGVRRVDVQTGEVITIARGLPLPRGVWGSGNDLYVVATAAQSIYRINLTTREARPFANIPNSRILWRLWGDGARLYVTDAGDCTIRKVSLSTAEVSLLAGNPGCDPNTFKDGSGTEARFRRPTSIWGDGQLLFVTDGYTLRTVHPVTGETHTIAGDWQTYGTENGVGADARFIAPDGIWGDGAYLYVGDRAIRRVTVPVPAVSSVNFAVQPGGGAYWKSSAADKPLQIAYARLQPNAGNSPPDGMVLFGFRPNGVLVSEASVPASPLIQSGRVYSEIGSSTRTGIAIANPHDSNATINFYFTDAAGANFGSGVTTIAANKQIALFLNEAPFNGTADARSFTFTSSEPVAAITLRGFVNERSDFLMTTLPVAPVTSTSSASIVLPQYATGGGWTTRILLVNPTDQQISGTVDMDATYSYSIAPRSAARVVASDPGPDIRTGVVRVNPAPGSRAAVSSSVFSFVSGGVTVTESGIATTGAAQSFRVFAEFDATQSLRTGVAVANLSTASTTVQFELLAFDGQPTGVSGSSAITGNGHLSLFLNELPGFQNLPKSFRGVLRISASLPISAIGLRGRYNERGDFLISTTPALADNAPAATGELVFPHIATGGGYTTEFLLLNRGSESAGTVSIFSQSGDKLPLPITR